VFGRKGHHPFPLSQETAPEIMVDVGVFTTHTWDHRMVMFLKFEMGLIKGCRPCCQPRKTTLALKGGDFPGRYVK